MRAIRFRFRALSSFGETAMATNKPQDEAPGSSADRKPDSTGTNARPRNETISQTGGGIPDDTSRPIDLDDEEAARIEEKIRNM